MNKNILISKDLLYKKIHIKYKKWKEKNARHKNILLFNRKLGISRFVPVQKKEELLENNRCIICQQDNPIKYHFISQDNEGKNKNKMCHLCYINCNRGICNSDSLDMWLDDEMSPNMW